jgi:hypothetical protein
MPGGGLRILSPHTAAGRTKCITGGLDDAPPRVDLPEPHMRSQHRPFHKMLLGLVSAAALTACGDASATGPAGVPGDSTPAARAATGAALTDGAVRLAAALPDPAARRRLQGALDDAAAALLAGDAPRGSRAVAIARRSLDAFAPAQAPDAAALALALDRADALLARD